MNHFNIISKYVKNPRYLISLLILSIYLSIVYIFTGLVTNTPQTLFFNLFLVLLAVLSSALIMTILSKALPNNISSGDNSFRSSLIIGFLAFLVTFGFFFAYQRGQFPGGLSPDSYLQYKMAMGDATFTNWHPALHTLIIFKLPLSFGRRLGMIILLQLFYFSIAVGYTVFALHQARLPRVALIIYCLFICLNPYLATFFMYPWKDIALAIFALMAFGQYIRIITTKGAWLEPWYNRAAFAVISVICGYMRHNAILFALPLIVIVLLYGTHSKRVRITTAVFVLVAFCLVKLLYAGFHVEKYDNLVVETIGMPITIWGNVMQKCPEKLPEKTRNVMYSLASDEAWRTIYVPGSFEELRYSEEFDNKGADRLRYSDVAAYTWQCFTLAPFESFDALAKLTGQVWGLYAEERPMDVGIWGNGYDIEPAPGLVAQNFVTQCKTIFATAPGRIIFGCLGWHLLIMLMVAAVLFARGQISWIHIIPVFAYDFGTCALLAGNYYRFFMLTIPLWIPVIYLMLADSNSCPALE